MAPSNSRLACLVEVVESPSLFLQGMAGSRMPIATSHGEGRAVFDSDDARYAASYTVALRYVDNYGQVADGYPANPNGSRDGICGLANEDGRVTIMTRNDHDAPSGAGRPDAPELLASR
jgi:phosphoribosylformylglycinamidine synthase